MKELDDINDDIRKWSDDNLADLKAMLVQLNVKHYKRSPNKQSLSEALKQKFRQKFGVIDTISYKMPRSAIFLHKGVSKGHPISNPRQAKEWFNPVVDKNIEKLGDVLAETSGNLVVNNLNIK